MFLYFWSQNCYFSEFMEIFKSVDIDGNGRIEKNELEIAFSKTLGRDATEVEVENMFKAVDMNDDGKISFDEYFTIMHVSLNADKEMQKLIDAFEVRFRLRWTPINASTIVRI